MPYTLYQQGIQNTVNSSDINLSLAIPCSVLVARQTLRRASPQSHSDWSETGIHSPPSNNNCVGQTSLQQNQQFHLKQQKQHQQQQMQHQQQQMAQQQMLQQQTDGVLI